MSVNDLNSVPLFLDLDAEELALVNESCTPRKYPKNSMMLSHVDHIQTLFDGTQKGIPVLSIIGLLDISNTFNKCGNTKDGIERNVFIWLNDTFKCIKRGYIIIIISTSCVVNSPNDTSKYSNVVFIDFNIRMPIIRFFVPCQTIDFATGL